MQMRFLKIIPIPVSKFILLKKYHSIANEICSQGGLEGEKVVKQIDELLPNSMSLEGAIHFPGECILGYICPAQRIF